MVDKKKKKSQRVPIEYTSRDYNSIKNDLLEHAKRYYPDTYQDFNDASFGSLMFDTVAYVGDILSFYLDYQANETFLDTASEYSNIIRHARRMGYDPYASAVATTGRCQFFITVPANAAATGPDEAYMPILQRGAKLISKSGAFFTLEEDVDFGANNTEIIVASSDVNGSPTFYAIKATGLVLSGIEYQSEIPVGDFKPFRRVQIQEPDLVEVTSVVDSQGHIWHEVEYLSQDVVYIQINNQDYDHTFGSPPKILKPISVPRRFIIERNRSGVALQFGSGESLDESDRTIDPSKVAIAQYGRNHVSDRSFDPHKLVRQDTLGAVPANTHLTVTYRSNNVGSDKINVGVGQISEIAASRFVFKDPSTLSAIQKSKVITSLEVTNEYPITGELFKPTAKEIRQRAKGAHAAQYRAVTAQDYESLSYAMPPKYGKIKRCCILLDTNSLKRNLNLYVISEDEDGRFFRTNDIVSYNLKSWLTDKKMMNDYIDIIPARIVNLGVNFTVIASDNTNKSDCLSRCYVALSQYFAHNKPNIGEHFDISILYKILNAVVGVDDTLDIDVEVKEGGIYASTKFDIWTQTSADGRKIRMPEDTVWEIKFTADDLSGAVK